MNELSWAATKGRFESLGLQDIKKHKFMMTLSRLNMPEAAFVGWTCQFTQGKCPYFNQTGGSNPA